jgi:hypothetical protein
LVADGRAEGTDFSKVVGTAPHEIGRHRAGVGAIHEMPDMVALGMLAPLFETMNRRFDADPMADVALFDARFHLVRYRLHGSPPF